jgi:uroporphyrinogen decarboxylase
MHSEPVLFAQLMSTLTEVLSRYLVAQVAAGAQVVQVFDSWAGVLDPASFHLHVFPHLQRLFESLGGLVPAIYFSTGSAHLLPEIAKTGAPGVSVDWRLPLGEAWQRIGPERFIQGNLDPAVLLSPWSVLEAAALRVLGEAKGRPGHIFNLGHGVLPGSDPAQLRRLVELVHTFVPN